jgi:prolipoprotein diacylglyceryltransferase
MRQVLFHIPLKLSWLPESLPLPLVLLVVGLSVGAALWLFSRHAGRLGSTVEGMRQFGVAVGIAGVVLAALVYQFADQFPDGVPVYGFGMMLFLAFIACTWLGGRRGEREGISKETIQDLAIWIFVGGLLGARTTFLLSEQRVTGVWDYLTQLPRIWDGGIVLYGSLVGAVVSYIVAYFLVFRKRGLSTRRLADVVAPSAALGVMLGRLGCFLNGCCFGQIACAGCALVPPAMAFPLSAPAGHTVLKDGYPVYQSPVDRGYQTAGGFTLRPGTNKAVVDQVDPQSQAYKKQLRSGATILSAKGKPVHSGDDLTRVFNPDYWKRGESEVTLTFIPQGGDEEKTITLTPSTVGLYPTQLYEVVSMGLLMLVLLAYDPFRRRAGQVAAVLLVGYGLHRFLNEILRDDSRPEGIERYGSVVCILAGVVLWSWLQWFKKEPDAPVVPVGSAAPPQEQAVGNGPSQAVARTVVPGP